MAVMQSPRFPGSEWHCGLRHFSNNLHQINRYIWWEILRQYCLWADFPMSWESPTRRRQEKLPGYQKVKEHFLAASKILSWWSRLQDARQFHRSSKRPFTEGFIEDDAVPLTESPEEATGSMKARSLLMKLNLPSAVTDAGGDALVEAKGEKTRSKEGMIGSTLRENHNLFTQFPKNPNCEVCNRTEDASKLQQEGKYACL